MGKIGGPLTVRTSKQSLVARSSTESELICLADGVSEVLQAQRILEFLGIPSRPAIIYQDNMSTKYLAEAGRGGKQGNSKHIDVRFFFVKQHIDCGDVKIEYLPTDDMTADMLTKPLLGHQFYKLRAKLMNHPENVYDKQKADSKTKTTKSIHPKHNGPKANLTSLTPFNSKECVGDHGAQERTIRTHRLQKVKRSPPLRESEKITKSRYVSDSPPSKC